MRADDALAGVAGLPTGPAPLQAGAPWDWADPALVLAALAQLAPGPAASQVPHPAAGAPLPAPPADMPSAGLQAASRSAPPADMPSTGLQAASHSAPPASGLTSLAVATDCLPGQDDPALARVMGAATPTQADDGIGAAVDRYVAGWAQPRSGVPAWPAAGMGGWAEPAQRTPPQLPRVGTPGPLTDLEVRTIRQDFPILHQQVHGQPLAWLDNAATTQKPRAVIEALSRFYERDNSNVHRAAHALAARATDAYEGARQRVQAFLGARDASEIVFVRGTTEAINLVAQGWGRAHLRPGDEVLVTQMEHHANIVPWQMVCAATGAKLRPIPITDDGDVDLAAYLRMLSPQTRMVALTHVSNVLGTVVPVQEMAAAAHAAGARVLVDGAQAVAHAPVDVCAIGCDFYVFSGHKIYGPTGVGVLYGRRELLDAMPPWQGGGNMIEHVTFEHTTYAPPPAKFEAGTATLADAVGLAAALDYLEGIGLERAAAHEQELLRAATAGLAGVPGLRIYGQSRHKAAVASFLLDGIAAEEVGRRLDQAGIAVRTGHHCAQPTMQRYGVRNMVRPSFALYNTFEEVDRLVRAVHQIRRGP